MVFKLIKFIFSIIFTVFGALFSVEFDGIPLWSITLFLLILSATLKILLGPVLSGQQPILLVRDKAKGYNVPINDNGKQADKVFIQTKGPGRWRR